MMARVIKAWRWVIALQVVGLLAPIHVIAADEPPAVASVDGYFFRLQTRYLHGDQQIDFDIVAGCNVQATERGGKEIAYARWPRAIVKATKDGGAILQVIPHACQSQTTQNGKVPDDFLPGAIWFDNQNDLTLGTAYFTQDAFNGPKSQLRFLGATISEASARAWVSYRSVAQESLLSPTPSQYGDPQPTVADVAEDLWDKSALSDWLDGFSCRGVMKFAITDEEGQAILRKYRPNDGTQYWQPKRPQQDIFYNELFSMDGMMGPDVNGTGLGMGTMFPIYGSFGFDTYAKGSPPILYPMTADDGLPWLNASLAASGTIYRRVSIAEKGLGQLYCYAGLDNFRSATFAHIPTYAHREFRTLVDDQEISQEDSDSRNPWDKPYLFVEEDKAIYLPYRIVPFR